MERLLQRCEQRFGAGLALDACLELMGQLLLLESSLNGNGTSDGIERCPSSEGQQQDAQLSSLPVVHNREHFAGPCTALELWTLRYVFPLLQLLCLGGNLLNLLVYRLPYFGGNSAVHLLRAKAVANLLFVQCRFMEVLHAWLPLQAELERLYWHSRPYLITLANINGTLSTWFGFLVIYLVHIPFIEHRMTMLISLQTMLCVLRPFAFRRFCARRPTLCCLVGGTLLAVGIHALFLAIHEVVSVPALQLRHSASDGGISASASGTPCFRIVTSFRMRSQASWAPLLERPYYWVQMSATIVLPTLVMLICTALVVSGFTLKPQLGQHFSQRRRCVIRLTVATTGSHLLLEGPAALSYALFALWGASMHGQREWMCALAAANNVLSALNATIPFFLFLLCSSQFRHMSAVFIQHRGAASVAGGGGTGGAGTRPSSAAKMSADDAAANSQQQQQQLQHSLTNLRMSFLCRTSTERMNGGGTMTNRAPRRNSIGGTTSSATSSALRLLLPQGGVDNSAVHGGETLL